MPLAIQKVYPEVISNAALINLLILGLGLNQG